MSFAKLGSLWRGAVATAAAGVFMLACPAAFAEGGSFDGLRGVLRVHSAQIGTPGCLSATAFGLYTTQSYSAEESARARAEEAKLGAGMLSLAYSATPYVELAVRGTVESQEVTPAEGAKDSQVGFGLMSFGIKTLLTPRTSTAWMLAAEISGGAPTGDRNALVGSWDHEGFDIGGRIDLTYTKLQQNRAASPRVHLNAGYLERTSEFDPQAWAASSTGGTPSRLVLHGDQFLYGAAVEIPIPRRVTFFSEWSGEYDLNAESRLEDSPMRITPGLRWSSRTGAISAVAGYEISMASKEGGPRGQLALGLTITGPVAPGSGAISGVVRDAETGAPISNVTIRARDTSSDPVVSDAKGKYRADLDEGYVVVDLTAEGYAPKTRVLEVKRNDDIVLDFALSRRNPFGVVRGRVQDPVSGAPIPANVRVLGQTTWTPCDSLSGLYTIENVPEGNVILEYEARGYRSTTAGVLVTAGHEAIHDVTLQRGADHHMGQLAGTVRDAMTGIALPATIQIGGEEPKRIELDASGSFHVELEAGKYPITVTSAGHLSKTETIEVVGRRTNVADIALKPVPSGLALPGTLFDVGSATIKRESRSSLEEAARFLTQNPEVRVVIHGHSDGMGSSEEPEELAQRRADAVMKYLVVNYGIAPNRLRAVGSSARTNTPGRVDLVIESVGGRRE